MAIILGSGLLIAGGGLILLVFSSRTEEQDRVEPAAPIAEENPPAPVHRSPSSSDDWDPIVILDPSSTPRSEESSLPTAVPFPFAPEEITVHLLSDFRLGEISNLLVEDALRLGDGPGFPPRGAPSGQRSGVYISPEQEPEEPFDVLVAEAETDIPDGSDLVFEFRVRNAEGDWSVWQRIEPNEMTPPLGLGAPASAWQYRLTFFANGSAPGPEVYSVAFATRPALLALPDDSFSQ